jgi:signal transduction histidine kinase
VDFPEKPPERALAGEDRHNLYLVVKESLNNVVKHAHASEVWLRAQVHPDHLSLAIEDNGRGLEPSAREAWADGLRNMRQRLGAAGGSVEVHNAPQKGTVVRIRFPLVEVRKTEPLEKLVWFARKEPDNERQTIQHGG